MQVYCTSEKKQLTVFETETCRYEAKLYLAGVCRVPAYKDLILGDSDYQESRTARLVCAPRDPTAAFDTSLLSGMQGLPLTLQSGEAAGPF